MKNNIEIDSRGFNSMIRHLKGYGQSTRPVVRAITSEVLGLAAKKTRTTTFTQVKESVNKNFRKPFEVPGKGFIGITKAGKVWVNLVSWGSKSKWAEISNTGKLKNVPKSVKRIGGSRADINLMIKAAKEFKKRELKYKKSVVGLSKASWYRLIKMLKLKMPSRAPAKYTTLKIPKKAQRALKAFERLRGRDNYSIVIGNAVQACLNKNSNGIRAFSLAINGKVKEFKRAIKKSGNTYSKDFARRHGFTVK